MFRYWQCFSPVWRKKNNNGIFSASVEEISDSDSQFSFSNEESSSMHVNIILTKRSICTVNFHVLKISELIRDVISARVFQDTNEAEAENTDKEGDFNLKVSRRLKVRFFLHLLFFVILSWTLEKLFIKREKKKKTKCIKQVFYPLCFFLVPPE